MRKGVSFSVSPEDYAELERVVKNPMTPQKHVSRAKIILLSEAGYGTTEIMRLAQSSKVKVWRWQRYYMEEGLKRLFRDGTRPPGKPKTSEAKRQEIVDLTMGPPPEGVTHWTLKAMKQATGVSMSTVHRIWREFGLMPHKVHEFKLSPDRDFAEKLIDVVGLYTNPPENAIVLSVDEKTQIQALDRTQPGLPIKPGRAQTMTHDYKRNGTATLFAALNTLTGHTFAMTTRRHRHQEFLGFLRDLDKRLDKDKDIHVILDNYATHKHAKVKAWLAKHPRWKFHFVPTYSSWCNAVEGVFAHLSKMRLKRGSFRSVGALIGAIHSFIKERNKYAAPYVWLADPAEIIAARKRGFQKIENYH